MRRRIALLLAGLPLVLALGWAAAGVVSAGGGCHGGEGQAQPSESSAAVVKIDGCTFAPTVARVPAGVEVQFLNSSISLHDIVGRDRAWGTESLNPGEQYFHRFQDAGVYPFSCSLHPGMAGVVIVGDAALAADEPAADEPAAAEGDMAQAVAMEPVATTETSVLPFVAIGAVSLLAGLAIGAAATRANGRRDPTA